MYQYQKGAGGVTALIIIAVFTAIIGGVIFYFFVMQPASENEKARILLAQEREKENTSSDVNSTEQAAIKKCSFTDDRKSYRAYFHGPRERLVVFTNDVIAAIYINDGTLVAYYNFEKNAWAKAKEAVATEVSTLLSDARSNTSIECTEIPFVSDLFRRADNPEVFEQAI